MWLRIGLKLSTVGAWALLSLTIYLYKFAKLMAKRVKICRFRYSRYSEIYTHLSPILTIPEHILKFMSLKLWFLCRFYFRNVQEGTKFPGSRLFTLYMSASLYKIWVFHKPSMKHKYFRKTLLQWKKIYKISFFRNCNTLLFWLKKSSHIECKFW